MIRNQLNLIRKEFCFKSLLRNNIYLFAYPPIIVQVLRHEEFTEGCDAQCNGPYDNRWSKTMIGYGPEDSHFVIELTYNYGVSSYVLGNDLQGITIQSNTIVTKAKELDYPVAEEDGQHVLTAPDGYRFFIVPGQENRTSDPVTSVTLSCTNLDQTIKYWQETLGMQVVQQSDKAVTLSFPPLEKGFALKFQQLEGSLDRAKAYGRIAFAVPSDEQPKIEEKIKAIGGSILTPLITLDTPGKATVRVIILGDPDGHEICFVDEEGFSQLSQVDDTSNDMLDKYLKKDPFQK